MASLPYDVLCLVVASSTPSSYPALCRTSRDLHSITAPLLYRSIDLDTVHQIERFLDSILSSQTLGRHVASLSIYRLNDTPRYGSNPQAVCAALRRMSHLQHLDLAPFVLMFRHNLDDFAHVLKELPEFNSVKCLPSFTNDTDSDVDLMLDALPPLKRLALKLCDLSAPPLGRLLLRSIDTLECFSADEYLRRIENLFALRDIQGRVWPRMRELKISTASRAIVDVFPGLTRLSITYDTPDPADFLWDQSLMRNIEQLHFYVFGTLPDVSRRGDAERVVPHLSLDVGLDSGADHSNDFYAVMLCFSLRNLRSLCLEFSGGFSAILDIFPTLLEGCSSLCYFGLRGDDGEKVDPYYLISSVLSSASKALRLKFINLDVKAIWNPDDSAMDILQVVRAHLTRVILAFFADNENLRVLQIATPDTAAYSWKRQQSVRGGEVGEAVAFATVHDASALPWSLSDIAELVDAYDT